MRAVIAPTKGKVVLADLPIPSIRPYEALVKMEACGICSASDRKFASDDSWPGPYPKALGHESVGRVVTLGDKVRHFRLGDRVLRVLLYNNHVPDGGCSRLGGMSEYGVVADARAMQEDAVDLPVEPAMIKPEQWPKQQIVPPDISPVGAALIISLKEGLVVLRLFELQRGEPLAIVGSGPVAQAFCFFAKYLGAGPVVVFARRPVFAERFRELGADAYVVGDDYPEVVKAQLAAGGFAKVIEGAGDRDALKRCRSLASPGGRICAYGRAPLSRPWDAEDLADTRLWHISGPPEELVHDEMLQLVASGRVKPEEWASHVMPVEEVEKAFAMLAARQATKIVLTF